MGNLLLARKENDKLLQRDKNEHLFNMESSKNLPDIKFDKRETYLVNRNPGCLENIHNDCMEIFPIFHEGATLVFNNMLSRKFQITHLLRILPDMNKGSYRFGTTYVGEAEKEATAPVYGGFIDRSGNLQANVMYSLLDNLRFNYYRGNKAFENNSTIDYFGSSYTLSLGLSNVDIKCMTGIIKSQYLQSITDNLALGIELVSNMKGGKISRISLDDVNIAARYSFGLNKIASKFSQKDISISFKTTITNNTDVAFHLVTDLENKKTAATLGYKVDVPFADIIFRGKIDTNRNICTVFEKRLKPFAAVFILSVLLNHKSNDLKMGCGLVLG